MPEIAVQHASLILLYNDGEAVVIDLAPPCGADLIVSDHLPADSKPIPLARGRFVLPRSLYEQIVASLETTPSTEKS